MGKDKDNTYGHIPGQPAPKKDADIDSSNYGQIPTGAAVNKGAVDHSKQYATFIDPKYKKSEADKGDPATSVDDQYGKLPLRPSGDAVDPENLQPSSSADQAPVADKPADNTYGNIPGKPAPDAADAIADKPEKKGFLAKVAGFFRKDKSAEKSVPIIEILNPTLTSSGYGGRTTSAVDPAAEPDWVDNKSQDSASSIGSDTTVDPGSLTPSAASSSSDTDYSQTPPPEGRTTEINIGGHRRPSAASSSTEHSGPYGVIPTGGPESRRASDASSHASQYGQIPTGKGVGEDESSQASQYGQFPSGVGVGVGVGDGDPAPRYGPVPTNGDADKTAATTETTSPHAGQYGNIPGRSFAERESAKQAAKATQEPGGRH